MRIRGDCLRGEAAASSGGGGIQARVGISAGVVAALILGVCRRFYCIYGEVQYRVQGKGYWVQAYSIIAGTVYGIRYTAYGIRHRAYGIRRVAVRGATYPEQSTRALTRMSTTR